MNKNFVLCVSAVSRICQHCRVLQSEVLPLTWSLNRHFHVSGLKLKMDQKRRKETDAVKRVSKKVKWAYIKPHMTVSELARRFDLSIEEVLAALELITDKKHEPQQEVGDVDTLEKVGLLLKRRFKIVEDKKASSRCEVPVVEDPQETPDSRDVQKQGPPDPSVLVSRPPVVTIMGHVDHGKTTLLDALRKSHIVDQEFGGITQHIGAFSARLANGQSITFLDTPGHAAFTAMRARGASVTDIVVLVVAADDGIMQQTVESIQHAQSAGVPLIVAINKIDKHEANVVKVKNMLAAYGVVLEEYGGDVQAVPVSALKGTNLDQLEECILTLAEFMELKGDPHGLVEGRVIETKTDPGLGKLATVLVQRGTLKKGDFLIAGTSWAKVRQLLDSNRQVMKKALPSTPVQVSGWKDLPVVGDEVLQVESERKLKKALEFRLEEQKREKQEEIADVVKKKREEEREMYKRKFQEKLELCKSKHWHSQVSLTRIERYKNKGDFKEAVGTDSGRPAFCIIIKGDVAGSVEAILDTLATFHSQICDLDILHSGIGDVTLHDIELAELFEGEIYAFNVGVSAQVASQKHSVPIRSHQVIYHLFDDLIKSISDRLPKKIAEQIIGEATILQRFSVTEKKGGKKKQIEVAGCRCLSGRLDRKQKFRIIRDNNVIYEGGPLAFLKHHKDEVSVIPAEKECGVCFSADSPINFQEGDTVICYQLVEEDQTLDWQPGFAEI